MDEAQEDVHNEVAHQCSLPLEVILPVMNKQGIEHAKVHEQLLEDPHRSFQCWRKS